MSEFIWQKAQMQIELYWDSPDRYLEHVASIYDSNQTQNETERVFVGIFIVLP